MSASLKNPNREIYLFITDPRRHVLPEAFREFSLRLQPFCTYAEGMTADELVETKMIREWLRNLTYYERLDLYRHVAQ